MHRFRVWCSPASPRAKGHSYLFNSIDEASWGLNMCLLRIQGAACSGSDRVYLKGRTYLLLELGLLVLSSWHKGLP